MKKKMLFSCQKIFLLIFVANFFFCHQPPWAENTPLAKLNDISLAKLNDIPISEEEVMKQARNRMMKILAQTYEVKRQVIDEIINDNLLGKEAQTKGLTTEKLLKQEVFSKVKEHRERELKTIFELQKNRQFRGKEYDQVKDGLKTQLKAQKERMQFETYLAGLREKAKIEIFLERPSVDVSVDDDPAMGNVNAPIKLIEFSEFQCPFCKRTRPTIDKILSTYKDQVYYVFRDFPLDFHQQAKGAAMAANCAHDQGKYWEFNKKLWDIQSSLSAEKYQEIAVELKLDLTKFNQCRESQKYTQEIDKDRQDGEEAGVSGTPAYFINGKFLSGAQPFENFKEIIDEELTKVKK